MTLYAILILILGQFAYATPQALQPQMPDAPNEQDSPDLIILSVNTQINKTADTGVECPYSGNVRIAVKNTGTKVIKSVGFQLALFYEDSDDNRRHGPSNYGVFSGRDIVLNPGDMQDINGQISCCRSTPFTRETAQIQRVEYTDGTIWQRLPKTMVRVQIEVPHGRAIEEIEPSYPPLPRHAHISGEVVVEIVVDRSGGVVSAQAVSGHPLLREASVATARRYKFNLEGAGESESIKGTIRFIYEIQKAAGQ